MAGFAWPDDAVAAVSFSFDDARESQIEVGVPLLDGLGVRATFYALPRLAELHVAAWRDAAMRGHEIGNHTVSHPCTENFPFARVGALERITLETIRRECEEADAWFESELGVRPTTFAYPCGQTYVGTGVTTQSYVPVVADRYVAARCFAEGAVVDPMFCNLHQLPAFDIDNKPLTTIEAIVEQALAAGGWVIFAGHEIGDGSARQTTGVFVLREIIRKIASGPRRVWVDTVSAISEYVAARRPPNGAAGEEA